MGRRNRSFLTNESIFFVTTTVIGFNHVFTNDDTCKILINNIVELRLSNKTLVEKWFSTSSRYQNAGEFNPVKHQPFMSEWILLSILK
jgi:hypothetical protein